jgi:hypothetical protein
MTDGRTDMVREGGDLYLYICLSVCIRMNPCRPSVSCLLVFLVRYSVTVALAPATVGGFSSCVVIPLGRWCLYYQSIQLIISDSYRGINC